MKRTLILLTLIVPLGAGLGCASIDNEKLVKQFPVIMKAMGDSGFAGTVTLRIVPEGGLTLTGPGVALQNDSEITVQVQFNAKGP